MIANTVGPTGLLCKRWRYTSIFELNARQHVNDRGIIAGCRLRANAEGGSTDPLAGGSSHLSELLGLIQCGWV